MGFFQDLKQDLSQTVTDNMVEDMDLEGDELAISTDATPISSEDLFGQPDSEGFKDLEAMLEEEKDNFGKNAYRYYANKYLAVQAAKAEDYAKGADLIAEAYKYYPVNEQCLKDLAEAAAIEDAKERYEKYYHCTTIQYNFWEERKVAVIDRS